MILFDGVHLASDTSLDELHAEARRIGLKREWFQAHDRHPHYDVFGALAKRVAVNCTPRELARRLGRARELAARKGGGAP